MAPVFLSRALTSAGDSLYCSQERTQLVRELLLWLLGGCLVPLPAASLDLQPEAVECGLWETSICAWLVHFGG